MKQVAILLLIGFPVLLGRGPISNEGPVRLSEGPDTSAGNPPCYIVTTPSATYFLEKKGGGLSSMLDKDGVDWIGFHGDPGSESKGEYRGFPNAIHQQDGNYFHPRNAATEVSGSRVELDTGRHVRIVFTSGNGKWEGRWDFFPDRCDFMMTKVSPGYKYWILYEGVPGGELGKTDFWYASNDRERHSIDEKNEEDLPGLEWMAFGDANSPRMIYLLHHENDTFPDKYYNMRGEMTVFGFGRDGIKKFLDTPRIFSIGFVESTDRAEVSRHVEALTKPEFSAK